ncbi:MAG: hypothetical protein KAS78_04615 [Candidatus Pacebacteria bacterium]|nr:hypothetical protein [Candidatus Paceibacterota bacterium]
MMKEFENDKTFKFRADELATYKLDAKLAEKTGVFIPIKMFMRISFIPQESRLLLMKLVEEYGQQNVMEEMARQIKIKRLLVKDVNKIIIEFLKFE